MRKWLSTRETSILLLVFAMLFGMAMLSVGATEADSTNVVSDMPISSDFKTMTTEQLGEIWTIIDETESNWALTAGKGLTLTSQKGELLKTTNTCKNIFTQSGEGDWIAETKITIPAQLSELWQQAGLMIYVDHDNYIKLVYSYDGSPSNPGIQYAYEQDGAFKQKSRVNVNTTEMWFRLKKVGDTYTAYYKAELYGNYQEIGSFTVAFDAPKLAFTAFNGTSNATPMDFTFEYIKILDVGTPVSSDFKAMTTEQLYEIWSIVDETESNWALTAGKGLTVTSQKGELFKASKSCKNIFTQSGEGDWVAETKITIPTDVSENWQQAGLMIYVDQDNYIKLVYSYDGYPGIQFGYEQDAVFTTCGRASLNTREIWFRLKKSGDTYSAYYTAEGPYNGFQEFGSCTVAFDAPKLAFTAFNGTADATPMDFTFEYIDILDVDAPLMRPSIYTMEIDKTELRLNPTETAQISAHANAEEAGNVFYKTSDEDVVTVDENGLVTAVGEGYAVITANVEGGRPAFCAVSVVPEVLYVHESIGNPYLPIWEHIPDGEPYVFEDPDNPGKYRVYVYGSHDTKLTHYCGYEQVVWSAPVDDLTKWTYHGEIFKSTVQGTQDTLYAPDMAEVINEDGTKTYYFYPNNQSAGRRSMVAKSSRPDGPFLVCNWSEDSVTQTVGPLGFDVAVLYDEGRAYGYWGFQNHEDCCFAELDPSTMATVKEGTEIRLNLPTRGDIDSADYDPTKYNIYQDEYVNMWGFFEAPSIRKIGNKYVLIFSRRGLTTEPWGCNTYQLGYGYSDSPEGPWKWGGIIVDAGGEAVPTSANGYTRTFPATNTHGSICEINGQWYVFYHRSNNNYSRQSMLDTITVEWDEKAVTEGGAVRISMAEMTSKGAHINGLDPYQVYPASIVCYLTKESASIPAVYDKTALFDSVVISGDQAVAGIKYFNFDKNAPDGKETKLAITVVPQGIDATVDVYLRPTAAANTAIVKENGIITSVGEGSFKVGSFEITADMEQRATTMSMPLTKVDELDGQWGLFFVFTRESEGKICDFRSFEFFTDKPFVEDIVPTVNLDTVYVSDGGTGDGTSSSAPIGSLAEAYAALGDDGGTIVITDTLTQTASFTEPSHSGKITITGGKLSTANIRYILNGATTFENITMNGTGSYLLVVAQFNPIVFGEGITVTGYGSYANISSGISILGGVQSGADKYNDATLLDKDSDITVKSGKVIIVGFSRQSEQTFTGTANINISGGTVYNIYLGPVNNGTGANAVLNISGGTFLSNISSNQISGNVTVRISGGDFSASTLTEINLRVTGENATSVADLRGYEEYSTVVAKMKGYTKLITGDLPVYVSDGGTGDGSSVTAPLGSISDAYAALGDKGGEIVVIGTCTVSATTFPQFNGNVTISGDSLTLLGDITFAKNTKSNVITLDLPVISNSGATIFGGFNSIVFGENFDVTGSVNFYGGVDAVAGTQGAAYDVNYALNTTVVTELPYSITVKNGTFGTFSGGNKRAASNDSSLFGAITAPLTVVVEGGTFNESFDLSGMSFLADNATLTVSGGTFNCPVYAQGNIGPASCYPSLYSHLVMSDKKYYAIDGDISITLSGGAFNGGLISAYELDIAFTQCLRGNFNLTIGEDATFASGTVLDATQVKAYNGESKIATLTCPDVSKFTVTRFDKVNGETVEYDEPLRISFVGDSITEGAGASNRLTKTYPAQFAALCEGEVVIGNYGVGTTCILPYGNCYETKTLAYPIAFNEADSDYIIIALGTNDAGTAGGTYGQMMNFADEYEAFVRAFGNLPDTEKVFTTSAIYRFTSNKSADVRAVSVIRPIQKNVTENLAKEDGAKYFYIDLYALLYDAAVTDELFASDKLHPNDAGYAIYGKAVYDAVFNDIRTVDNFGMSDIYLCATGNLDGAGTKDDPMSSLTTAFGKLASDGTLHIMGEYTYPDKIVTPMYMEKLTIVGEGEGAVLTIDGDTVKFLSNTKLDNFVLTTTKTTAFFCCNWNDMETTTAFDCSSGYRFIGGQVLFNDDISKGTYDSTETASVSRDVTFNLNGGSFYQFLGGNVRLSSDSPYGTYSGNMSITIGEGVTIAVNGSNGIGGQNYLSGTVNATVNSWPANQLCRDYPRIGSLDTSARFNESNNTGTTVMTFGEGVTAKPIITGDFDGDEKVTFSDVMLLLKQAINHDGTTEIHDFYSYKKISLINVIRALKKLV